MDSYHEETYGERIASVYDSWYADYDPAALTTLAQLARGGRVLELGIGTGRIAIPLCQAGVAVSGIDASPAMVARLRSKTGSEDIPVTIGNFADLAVEGRYALIYVLFNTFFGLLTQDEQLRCFENVSQHLVPGGSFLVEAFVPDLNRFVDGQAIRTVQIGEQEVRVDAAQHDSLLQQVISQHIVLTEQGTRFYPVKLRYAWPSELDLMARLAGLQRSHRWGAWDQSAFTASSKRHISVYALPG
ncbi:MAG: class I SAM-dependent methyltransferase [Anaerolineales bacterium]|jgi:SAM-dependent methyltransferase|nr:class I SAM-dependent methyltransferase [Anaerolineales bacterium]